MSGRKISLADAPLPSPLPIFWFPGGRGGANLLADMVPRTKSTCEFGPESLANRLMTREKSCPLALTKKVGRFKAD